MGDVIGRAERQNAQGEQVAQIVVEQGLRKCAHGSVSPDRNNRIYALPRRLT